MAGAKRGGGGKEREKEKGVLIMFKVKGTGSRFSACSLIKLLFSIYY